MDTGIAAANLLTDAAEQKPQIAGDCQHKELLPSAATRWPKNQFMRMESSTRLQTPQL